MYKFLIVLLLALSSQHAFAGERQEKIVAFAGGASVTPGPGVSIYPQNNQQLNCENSIRSWKLDEGPYGELYKHQWTVQRAVQCLSTQLMTPEKDVTPITPPVRQDSSSWFGTAPPRRARPPGCAFPFPGKTILSCRAHINQLYHFFIFWFAFWISISIMRPLNHGGVAQW